MFTDRAILFRTLDRSPPLGYIPAMTTKRPNANGSKPGARDTGREDRLKAALKANLGRRKQQARARATNDATQTPEQDGADGQTKD
jgi:hypothetical protein